MSTKIKGLISDFVRVGGAAAAFLVILVNAAPSLHIPASWVAYISVGLGILNAAIGLAKPYAVAAVKSVRK